MSARYIIGDTLSVLAQMPEASIDLVLCSPPFLALRSYLPDDHPDKALEIGLGQNPGEFIDTLLDVVEACERILAPHGSIVIELGDTYSESGGHGGDYAPGGMRDGQPKFEGSARTARQTRAVPPRRTDRPNGCTTHGTPAQVMPVTGGEGWPLGKSLCLIPELFRVALVYGFNPLTGRSTPPWRARNVIRWCRPNPPVGALGDKVRPATSDLVVICKDRTRYFDLDAVRKVNNPARVAERNYHRASDRGLTVGTWAGADQTEGDQHPAGAPPLDHWWIDDSFDQDAWLIATQPYPGSHYATWPEELCVTPIKAMCPQRVCTTCGEPSRRLVETGYEPNRSTNGPQSIERKHLDGGSAGYAVRADRVAETIGWSCCGCCSDVDTAPHNMGDTYCGRNEDHWRNGVVLDPFAGSGTTLAVATGHGRDAIGIDLDARNAALALDRVGPLLLSVERLDPAVWRSRSSLASSQSATMQSATAQDAAAQDAAS